MPALGISGIASFNAGVSLARRSQCLSSEPARRPHAAGDFGVLLDRFRSANEIALDFAALFVGEESELLFGFHALGQDREVQSTTERDDRADNGRGLLAVAEIGDKGLVNLDLVEGERLQIRQ